MSYRNPYVISPWTLWRDCSCSLQKSSPGDRNLAYNLRKRSGNQL